MAGLQTGQQLNRESAKIRIITVALAFFCSLLFVSPAKAQLGCQVTPHYSNYSSQSFDDSNFNFSQTVTTDGYGQMNIEFCLEANNATHTAYGVNKITEPNGTVHGGSFHGSPVCATNCYVFAQNTITFQGTPGVVYRDEIDGSVVCSIVGTFWSVTSAGNTRFVQAYYYRDDSSQTYHRCNPVGDACDTVYLVNSPVTDGGWPQYGLFNAVHINTGIVNLCIVGRHGVRADMCIKPDPHP